MINRLKQEGWLSPTECASVSAISRRHIIWLPHESHAGMALPSADLWVRHSDTSRESKAHFGLPGYAPATIAVMLYGWKEDSMLVKRIAACTQLSSTVSQ